METFDKISDPKSILFYYVIESIVEKLFVESSNQMKISEINKIIYYSLSPFWESLGMNEASFQKHFKMISASLNKRFTSREGIFAMEFHQGKYNLKKNEEKVRLFISLNLACMSIDGGPVVDLPQGSTIVQSTIDISSKSPRKKLLMKIQTIGGSTCQTTFDYGSEDFPLSKENLELKSKLKETQGKLEETRKELEQTKFELLKANDTIFQLRKALEKQKSSSRKRIQQEEPNNNDVQILSVEKRNKVIELEQIALELENPNYCVITSSQTSFQVADLALFSEKRVEIKKKNSSNPNSLITIFGFEIEIVQKFYSSQDILVFKMEGSENWISFPNIPRKHFNEKIEEWKICVSPKVFCDLKEKEGLDIDLVERMSTKNIEYNDNNSTPILDYFSTTIRISDLHKIENNQFMNNEMYNCFLRYLKDSLPKVPNLVFFFETFFFVEIQNIEEKMNKMNFNELKQHEWLIIPVNIITVHWYLICVNLIEINSELNASIYIIDSMQKDFGGTHVVHKDNVSEFLCKYLSVKNCSFEYKTPPQQPDGTSCGYRMITSG
eukprot:TRINITY_DN910_c0_g5_i1.p1 TRINITY_DN910_c0_g5~~TRINITY_DN910_c0_g5_i1.p1  ORF type:complete len:553 (+),score=116.74 TRINITY_DN910_c0_g5_i1:328-1986(+)